MTAGAMGLATQRRRATPRRIASGSRPAGGVSPRGWQRWSGPTLPSIQPGGHRHNGLMQSSPRAPTPRPSSWRTRRTDGGPGETRRAAGALHRHRRQRQLRQPGRGPGMARLRRASGRRRRVVLRPRASDPRAPVRAHQSRRRWPRDLVRRLPRCVRPGRQARHSHAGLYTLDGFTWRALSRSRCRDCQRPGSSTESGIPWIARSTSSWRDGACCASAASRRRRRRRSPDRRSRARRDPPRSVTAGPAPQEADQPRSGAAAVPRSPT